MNMSNLLKGWTPTKKASHMELDVPAGKIVDLRLCLAPCGPGVVLLRAEMPNGAPLWTLGVAGSGRPWIRLGLDSEALTGNRLWVSRGPLNITPFDVAITYNASAGGVSVCRWSEALTGKTLTWDGDWRLIVGARPEEPCSPEGWVFDLDWTLVEQPAPILKPNDAAYEMLDTACAHLNAAAHELEMLIDHMKGGRS